MFPLVPVESLQTASNLPTGNHMWQNITASSPCFGIPLCPCTWVCAVSLTPTLGRYGRCWNATRHFNIWLFSWRLSEELGPRKQIAPGSLIRWSLGPNWIMDSRLSMCTAFVHVPLMRLGGPCWVNVLRGPLTLVHQFQSGSTALPPLASATPLH